MTEQSIQLAPRAALTRWLAQIHYNAVRNIEASFAGVTTSDTAKPLRGFKIADDLVLTRKRTFYQIKGAIAAPLSIEAVSANYNLKTMQASYRAATEAWKSSRRRRRVS
jgi:hypothetical protein